MISIQKINSHNVWAILKLSVNEQQKDFVATNTESIVEDYCRWCGTAIWNL